MNIENQYGVVSSLHAWITACGCLVSSLQMFSRVLPVPASPVWFLVLDAALSILLCFVDFIQLLPNILLTSMLVMASRIFWKDCSMLQRSFVVLSMRHRSSCSPGSHFDDVLCWWSALNDHEMSPSDVFSSSIVLKSSSSSDSTSVSLNSLSSISISWPKLGSMYP